MYLYAIMYSFIYIHLETYCVPTVLSHLSDLLAHQSGEPDVKQYLASGGPDLKVHHQHHSKKEEEGKVRHDIPVKFNLRGAVQAHKFGPAAEGLHAPQITAKREVHRPHV